MKERALALTEKEVRACLTAERPEIWRPIKDAPRGHFWRYSGFGESTGHIFTADLKPPSTQLIACHLGGVGDLLWVRETWFDNNGDRYGTPKWERDELYYKADGEPDFDGEYIGQEGTRWASPVTMPQWCSRITLTILSVRAEWDSQANGWFWVLELEQVKP